MTARLIAVRPHDRKRPYAAQYAATTAKLMAEVEACVDRQIVAALRTFHLNTWRALGRKA